MTLKGIARHARDWGPALLSSAYVIWAAGVMWRYRDLFPNYDGVTVEIFIRYLWDKSNPLALFSWYANEHRPVFPLVVFIIDHYLAGSSGIITLTVLGICNILIVAFLVWTRRGAGLNARTVAVLALGAVLMFWPGHYENLVWPIQLHMYYALAAGAGALVLVIRAMGGQENAPNVGWPKTALIGLLLFQSCFSFAYGFILTAVVFVISFVRFGWSRLPLVAGTVLAGSVAIYVILFKGLSMFGGTVAKAASLGDMARFIVVYIGAPFGTAFSGVFGVVTGEALSPDARVGVAMVFGVAAVAVAARILVAAIRAWIAGRLAAIAPERWFLIGMTGFAFGSAAITAAARLEYPPPFPVDTLRYYIVTVYFWLAVFADAAMTKTLRLHWIAAAFTAIAAVFVVSGFWFLESLRYHATVNRQAGTAGMSEMSDLVPNFLHPDLLPDLYRRYADTRSLLYAKPWARLKGRAIADAGLARSPATCPGAIEVVSPVEGVADGYVLSGYAAAGDATWLIVVDGRGLVVGYGSVAAWRPNAAGARPWSAYARDAVLPLAVELVMDKATICKIGSADTAAGPQVKRPLLGWRTDFESARTAPGPGPGLVCPDRTERLRWVTGALLCMPRP